jgi:dihydrofolate reductase
VEKIALIAAMCKENQVIGVGNQLPPWNAPGDLKRFKALTEGGVVVMGRSTFQSIGKPLKGRYNVVLSEFMPDDEPGIHVARTVLESMKIAGKIVEKTGCKPEIMIIGGSKVYKAFMPFATKIYLTEIYEAHEGDTFFPAFGSEEGWSITSLEEHEPTHCFVTYERSVKMTTLASYTA